MAHASFHILLTCSAFNSAPSVWQVARSLIAANLSAILSWCHLHSFFTLTVEFAGLMEGLMDGDMEGWITGRIYLSTYLPACMSLYPFIYPPLYLSTSLPVHLLSTCLPVYLSTYLAS